MPSELFTMGAISGSGVGVGCPPCRTPTPDPCTLEGMLAKGRTAKVEQVVPAVNAQLDRGWGGNASFADFMRYIAQAAPELAVEIMLWYDEQRKKAMNPSYQCGKPWTYTTG